MSAWLSLEFIVGNNFEIFEHVFKKNFNNLKKKSQDFLSLFDLETTELSYITVENIRKWQ